MADIPLLFLFHHGGLPPHVRTALALLSHQQAAAGDAAPRFVFAGNIVPEYDGQIEFIDTSSFQDSLDFLRRTFQYQGAGARDWQILAMWRWFVLAELLRQREHTGSVVFLDSDVFVYDNPALILGRFDGAFGFGADTNPGICFFRTPEAVFELRDLIAKGMEDVNLRAEIVEALGSRIHSFGGDLQEMGYISHFCQTTRAVSGLVAHVNEATEAGIYDYSVNFDQPGCMPGFLCDDFGKVVVFKDDQPYFLRRDDAKPIRALTLHIHGSAKRHIGKWVPKNFGG